MHISEMAFQRKTIFYFLLAVILVGGILSFMRISKLEDPEIVLKQARVVTIYPGASAHEVEPRSPTCWRPRSTRFPTSTWSCRSRKIMSP